MLYRAIITNKSFYSVAVGQTAKSMSCYKICVVIGLLALLHAAYSAAQHRAYLRLTEQVFTQLPWDILIQCLLSLIIVIYGVTNIAGGFREIRASAELDHKTWDMLENRQGFLSFNHRGKMLHGHLAYIND